MQNENRDQIKEIQIDKINSAYKNENFLYDITSSKQKSYNSKQSPKIKSNSKKEELTSLRSK